MTKKSIFLTLIVFLLVTACNQPVIQSPKLEDTIINNPTNQAPDNINSTNTPATDSPMTSQNDALELKNQTILLETNFGNLNIKMLDEIAPLATENFIKLSAKGYYNGTIFHRIVKASGFSIIQGGDPTATGRGGESAFSENFADETFDQNGNLPEIYGEFNGQYCTYKKGLIAMANAGPNTNGSQFFIMLDDTNLPPDYTIFGQIEENDFLVLDKIYKEVNPDSPLGDGKPNQEIKIIKASPIL